MRGLWTVFAKEAVDNCRDRRTLLSTLLFVPLLGPLILALATTSIVESAGSQDARRIELPIAGAEHAPNLVGFLRQRGVGILPAPEDPERSVRTGDHEVVLVIPAAFPEAFRAGRSAALRLFVDRSDRRASIAAGRVRAYLKAYSDQIGRLRLMVRGVDPRAVDTIALELRDVSTPQARGAQLLGVLPYFLMFAILAGGFHLAIDSTAGERERGSLEALLSTPVRRSVLMLGKLASTCFFSVVSLLFALCAFALSLAHVPLEEVGLAAHFGLAQMIRIFAVSLPFAVLGAALLTAVAAFTRSVKEAQTYLSALILIPMAPIFLTVLSPVRPALWMMFVPSLSQHLLVTNVMKGATLDPTYVAASVASTLLLGGFAIALAARLYERESVLG
jgi:sodium transport system permease protein